MSEHKLEAGKRLIRGLIELGATLGYHVEKEFPVEQTRHRTPPAVDVAWFTEKGQVVPLFIFEVESRATNAMTNNPLKVFAQETRRFEKPLFFFQVIGSHADESSRVGNLERQYGTYNYRIYVIGENKGNELIKDVLGQHRRIRNGIDYVGLYSVLSTEWRENVDIYQALRDAFDVGLSPALRLPAYVQLALSDSRMVRELRMALPIEADERWPSIDSLPSYLGESWGVPILCAMMVAWADTEAEAKRWNEELMRWQDSSAYLPMITASFGLSWDYDQFLIGVAAPLVALCCALASEKAAFLESLCDVLSEILSRLHGSWYALHTACWLAHISARFELEKHFVAARNSINELGGIEESILYCPPSIISTEIAEDEAFPTVSKSLCPELEEFRTRALRMINPVHPERVALNALASDSYLYEWAEDLVGALWNNCKYG
ncbi:hypothetical protein ACJU26_14275 [Acidithiobacillus sp. M4-SHS-6]|uniref:hypothetical protein n=1 Tax=Acidithiobacillus sp. M4-SHS-6 TaxID=3383024 RepID=UPI0039BE6975